MEAPFLALQLVFQAAYDLQVPLRLEARELRIRAPVCFYFLGEKDWRVTGAEDLGLEGGEHAGMLLSRKTFKVPRRKQKRPPSMPGTTRIDLRA